MSTPLISIVVATYNSERTLERCLESVMAQTFPSWELQVIDGASKDRTLEIVRASQARDSRIQLSSEPDRGIYDAFNKGVRRSRGDWILFLGSDDWLWDPSSLERIVPGLKKARDQGIRVAYGKVAVVTSLGETLHLEGEPWEKIGKKFLQIITLPHQGTFQHRALFDEHGLFDESYRISGDYEFLLRELKSRPAYFCPNGTVSAMSVGGVSSQLENTLKILAELARARRQNGLRSPSPEILFRIARARSRRVLRRVLGERATHHLADLYRMATGKSRFWTKIK
jgi:hypothetical protein